MKKGEIAKRASRCKEKGCALAPMVRVIGVLKRCLDMKISRKNDQEDRVSAGR